MITIKYPVKGSAFTSPCSQVLRNKSDALKNGEVVAVALGGASGGYPGDVVVEIDGSNSAEFCADWKNPDPTRFPARIKGAAHALYLLDLGGRYRIRHSNGNLTILFLGNSEVTKPPSGPIVGNVPGTVIGEQFSNRKALTAARIHNYNQQGISSDGLSIVLSGGYVDDVDEGEQVLYTGEGKRDLKTGRQYADQEFKKGNLALARNYTLGNPIRVTRGYGLDSPFAPAEGYRYDGLYRIDRYWSETGIDGFLIWRYWLTRHEEQGEIGEMAGGHSQDPQGNKKPPRATSTVSRVIRNSAIGNRVKEIYDHTCQVCGIRLETPGGPYAEACHIRPLGKPHNGPDTLDNVLCLCPTHHVLMDYYAIRFADDFTVIGTGKALKIDSDHSLEIAHIQYHRDLI